MSGCKNLNNSTLLFLVWPPSRDYLLLVVIFCDRNDRLLRKQTLKNLFCCVKIKSVQKSQFCSMNNALLLNVSEWSFFCFGVYLFLLLFIFIIFLFVLVFNCFFFNNKNNSFFGLRYVPLVIKAKRNAAGLFQCNLAEIGTMLILSFFYS